MLLYSVKKLKNLYNKGCFVKKTFKQKYKDKKELYCFQTYEPLGI